jgi:hypothetical protein
MGRDLAVKGAPMTPTKFDAKLYVDRNCFWSTARSKFEVISATPEFDQLRPREALTRSNVL